MCRIVGEGEGERGGGEGKTFNGDEGQRKMPLLPTQRNRTSANLGEEGRKNGFVLNKL